MKDVFNWNSKRSLYKKAVAPYLCSSDSQAILSEFRYRSQLSISRTSKPRRSWSGWNLMRNSDCYHARVLGDDGHTQQVLSFTVTKKKKKLVFPMTVTIPTVGKVTIEHAGPRPAHVPKLGSMLKTLLRTGETQNMVPGLLRVRLLG